MNPGSQSGDKSRAVQTLRAVRWRPAVAKRLDCVRLQRRSPGSPIASWVQGFNARYFFSGNSLPIERGENSPKAFSRFEPLQPQDAQVVDNQRGDLEVHAEGR